MKCFFKASIQNFEILFLRGGGGGCTKYPVQVVPQYPGELTDRITRHKLS